MTMTIPTYDAATHKAVRHEALWYAMGYCAGVRTPIDNSEAISFANSYADSYVEWTKGLDPDAHPGLQAALTEWLAKQ